MTDAQTATELTIANNNKTEEDTKTTEDEIKCLKDLFYIYYKHKIMGPYRPDDIFKLYVAGKIEQDIFIKNAKDFAKEGEWYPVYLGSEEDKDIFRNSLKEKNEELKEQFPSLYDFLIPKLTEIIQSELPQVCITINILIYDITNCNTPSLMYPDENPC